MIEETEEAQREAYLAPLELCIPNSKSPWLSLEEKAVKTEELLHHRKKWERNGYFSITFPVYSFSL